jgi:hypothetical protein
MRKAFLISVTVLFIIALAMISCTGQPSGNALSPSLTSTPTPTINDSATQPSLTNPILQHVVTVYTAPG